MASNLMNSFCRLLVVALFCVTNIRGLEREISSYLNPGCENCSDYFFLHIEARGPDDTLHYVWDLTHKPSMLLVVTNHSAALSVDWDNYGNEGSISFNETAHYSFGIALNKIWEYNDVNDTGVFDPKNNSLSYIQELNPENFMWQLEEYNNGSRTTTFSVKSELYQDNTTSKNGSVVIKLQGFGFLGHSEALPHLLHTPNTSQVDIIIDNFETNFRSSRFAMELALVSSDRLSTPDGDHFQIVTRKSLDDEHAPGVFTLVDVETPLSAKAARGGYLQWRPVAYISSARDMVNSTDTNVFNPTTISYPEEYLLGSLLPSYFSFNTSADNQPLVQATIVSFGLKEDGFYRKTNYTAWTFTVGYGKPPDEDFSLLVILVISIGLGLPATLILASGLVVLIRRVKQKKDDLFLGR